MPLAPIHPHLIRELRTEIASAISDFKSYDVPGVCKRLGLADGDSEEAFRSKFKYASSRLAAVPADDLLGVAKLLLQEVSSYRLSELVAKIQELGRPALTEVTRRRLLSVFRSRRLATEMEDVELIQRAWPVAEIPSPFGSTGGILEDIYQHTVRNYDWDNDELLIQLGFLTCSQAQLFRFMEEVTAPVVQTSEAQATLVSELNGHLQHDGFRLAMTGKVSGSPIYKIQQAVLGSPADQGISAALQAFDPGEVHSRWIAAVERRIDDPRGAITLARTLLEDVCKWILAEANVDCQEKDDLPVLYRKLAKVLRLAPDDHTEQTFRQLLGSCQQIVELLGSLRSKLGDAHSPGPKRAKASPRHAELAVNLSGTMATFLVDTWKARKDEASKASESAEVTDAQ
ncbi:abortive infection family protein [Rhizobium laguerreae]|uniref:abortive infection family protein n=1 Tax=Rhizobium laguerreae TaxID=1076926 RepID=UPI001C91FEE0|nr:abortive infection family protein [Rhizobium laguerreae]MBY3087984.1 abortive infection family protein [Rhizobium laguerreae]MBY3148823.1 abortive infection family protein [Rhizobium laguerreae]